MLICFLDEAGTSDLRQGFPKDVFVLAGVIVGADQSVKADNEFAQLKKNYELNEEDEIHSAWVDSKKLDRIQSQITDLPAFAKKSKKDRRIEVKQVWQGQIQTDQTKQEQKDYKKWSPYMHLTSERRSRLLQDACDILVNLKLPVIVCALDCALHSDGPTTYGRSFMHLTSWFQSLLENRPGLVVHDASNKERLAKDIVKTHQKALGKLTSKAHTIYPVPLFVDSKRTKMIGFADVAAYAVRKYLRCGDESFSVELSL